ncbi:MAG: hypothetical protein WB561_16945 [Terracidiphilus sp.]
MSFDGDSHDGFEISLTFRRTIENRIARLERDALSDESLLPQLTNSDHQRRQMRLIDLQRAEARRMRRFLDQSRTRLPRPMIAL